MATWTRKKYRKLAKGFYGKNKNCARVMIPRVEKSLSHAYVSRRLRPRNLRKSWIQTINAACQE